MKPQEIVETLKANNAKLLANIPDTRAANIVRQVLLAVGSEVDRVTQDQPLRVAGLGVFRMKKTAADMQEKHRYAFTRIGSAKAGE
jgi:hypothetical protein